MRRGADTAQKQHTARRVSQQCCLVFGYCGVVVVVGGGGGASTDECHGLIDMTIDKSASQQASWLVASEEETARWAVQ